LRGRGFRRLRISTWRSVYQQHGIKTVSRMANGRGVEGKHKDVLDQEGDNTESVKKKIKF